MQKLRLLLTYAIAMPLYVDGCIPYSTKLWREKTLADLADNHQSAKVLSAKNL